MAGKKAKTALSMVEEKTPEPDDSQPLSDEQLEAMWLELEDQRTTWVTPDSDLAFFRISLT
eukprot:10445023-Karenia_brevis.AAC.1